MHWLAGMTVDRARRERAIQEQAQALAAGGGLEDAVRLLDRHLARFDGDWGLWLYFAGLCAKCGRRDQAVAAYRASSRQLEGDGFFARARAALVCAARLAPRDAGLKREVERVGRLALLPEASSEIVAGPRPDPFALLSPLPALPQKTRSDRFRRPAPVVADPAMHVTSLLPDRPKAKRRRAPTLDSQTDPHCPIFEFLDAERSGNSW